LLFVVGKNESKTSYGNFPLAKKLYFVRKITSYPPTCIGSILLRNDEFGTEKHFRLLPQCKRIRCIMIYSMAPKTRATESVI